MTLLIVADDLTGAADSAARCFHAGLPATVFMQLVAPPWPPGAVALSTDSRHLLPSEAAARVRLLLAPLRHAAATWYKKIDSTLRGNIGAELDAMLSTLAAPGQPAVAVVCPAFPAQGRGLMEGRLWFPLLQGEPPDLPALLAQQTERPVVLIALADVRAGEAVLAARLQSAVEHGAQILVVDARTDADLATILAAVQRALPHALLCGSAGLMAPLARAVAQQEGAPHIDQKPLTLQPPLLAVVGSGSTMAHRQIDALRQTEEIAVVEIGQDQSFPLELEGSGKRAVILHLPKPDAATPLEGHRARALAATLAETAVRLAPRLQPGLLLLVGGDTTVHMLERMGIRRLTVLAELMPGIPLLEGVDDSGSRALLITKAGNFGDEHTLQAIYAKVATHRRPERPVSST